MAKTKKDYLEDYINSDAFKYDLEDDPIFEVLKRTYSENAKRTAEDLLGKYSQVSGLGSVSSHAISAAGQGANSELGKLYEQIPELYELAREMYDADMAEKERKFKVYLDYEKSNEKKEASSSSSDAKTEKEEEPKKEDIPEEKEEQKDEEESPGVDYETDKGNSYSKGDNGITTGSLATTGNSKHVMNSEVYTMTKKLVKTYMSVGRRSDAETLYSKFKNSMSASQRLEIESLLGK